MLDNEICKLRVLVMAGGRGTRFWPLSRARLPKQCIALTDEKTLIQHTIKRLIGLVEPGHIFIATGRDMESEIRAQLPEIPAENFLVEPRGRNTAPCIAWGAVEIARRSGGETVMAVLPADHIIRDDIEFRDTLAAAAIAAASTNSLVTIGIKPDRPETGFGYLFVGGDLGSWGGKSFHRVKKFIEKPDKKRAQEFIESGEYLWNAGMFCWTIDAIRDAYREYLPGTWAAMEELTHNPSRLEDLWARFDATSIDYGVMERSPGVLTVPANFGWSDVGSWTAIPEVHERTTGGWVNAKDRLSKNARGNVVHSPKKLVALLGVEDLVVVDTEDVLLVGKLNLAQDVRSIIEELERRGLTQYL